MVPNLFIKKIFTAFDAFILSEEIISGTDSIVQQRVSVGVARVRLKQLVPINKLDL